MISKITAAELKQQADVVGYRELIQFLVQEQLVLRRDKFSIIRIAREEGHVNYAYLARYETTNGLAIKVYTETGAGVNQDRESPRGIDRLNRTVKGFIEGRKVK